MKRSVFTLLAATLLLSPSGCTLFSERTHEIVWAKMGTPARIVDSEPVKVLVPQDDGKWTPLEADLSGMIAIDEPTLNYLKSLDKGK